jgi:ubiquinone biosynthesis protein COQ4
MNATAPLQFAMNPTHRTRPQWWRAIRAMHELTRNPEQIELAFEIGLALEPNGREGAMARLLSHPEGRRLYERRPSLRAALVDRAALERLPENSFGRAYLEHIDHHGLDPAKLTAVGRDVNRHRPKADEDLAWLSERGEMTHDLWHVLSGYGADELGEATLLWFSFAQTGGRANALLSFGAGLRAFAAVGPRWIPYAWKAWRRGRRAVCLTALPYEDLLPLPLSEVRSAARIDPPDLAHPKGIWRRKVVHPSP